MLVEQNKPLLFINWSAVKSKDFVFPYRLYAILKYIRENNEYTIKIQIHSNDTELNCNC